MDKQEIAKIHQRVQLIVKAEDHTIETHESLDNLTIVQYKDYTIKKYSFIVRTTENTYVSIRIRNGKKWIEKEGNTVEFDIDKPFEEIEVGFAISSIPPIKKRIRVSYANKKAWDQEVEECRIKRMIHELNLGIYSGNDFVWFLTCKPEWLDHFDITLKIDDYEFCKVSSSKKEHIIFDKIPNGEFIAVCQAFDDKGLVVTFEKKFKIKSKPTDPDHSEAVSFWR